MADPQGQTDSESDGASTPPEKKTPAKAVKKTARAPAKKAGAKKAAAKKVPAKKAPAKKAQRKKVEPPPPKSAEPAEQPVDVQQLRETNGDVGAAAKDDSAQAKSTVE